MRFYMPTDVYIEKNCVKNHAAKLCAFGKKAFIVTGRHSSQANGSLKDVTDALEEGGVSYKIFNEVEENPSTELCGRAAEIGKDFGADFVIGIGGGSPMDASKAIALLIANPEETTDCFYNKKDIRPLPIITVPTTCGTGSEVTGKAVLTTHEQKTKRSILYDLFPDLALVDEKYLENTGKKIIVSTAVDALAHAIESRLHSKANIYNRMYSEYAMTLWKDLIPYLMGYTDEAEDTYERLMLVANIAGIAIAQTGTSIPHALSYELTYHHGVPHGIACGYFLAAYMDEYAEYDYATVSHIMEILGFKNTEKFGSFLNMLIGFYDLSEADCVLYAENFLENKGKRATYPYEVSQEIIEKIIRNSVNVE